MDQGDESGTGDPKAGDSGRPGGGDHENAAVIRELRDIEAVLREAEPESKLLGDSLARMVVDSLVATRRLATSLAGCDGNCSCAIWNSRHEAAMALYRTIEKVKTLEDEIHELAAIGPTGQFPLGKLNNKDRGEIGIAISTANGKLTVRFGEKVDWIALDKLHLNAFIAILTEKGKELR